MHEVRAESRLSDISTDYQSLMSILPVVHVAHFLATCLLVLSPTVRFACSKDQRSDKDHVTVSELMNNTNATAQLRDGRVLSLFQIVTFPNDACVGSSSRNGTCYTSDECSARGGASSGTCANGFGVCCVISLDCGGTSSENNTYLVQSSTTSVTNPDPCVYTICPTCNDICRIKFDFNTFDIAGPQVGTSSAAIGTAAPGNVGGAVGDCLTDTFTITNPNGDSPPLICGYNTGQHMIVDATNLPNCHKVTFDLSGSGSTRSWDITVYQYSCSDPTDVAGPKGCLQYFTGTTGTLANFNFPTNTGTVVTTTTHLSNQCYSMCIRTELGFCAICYAQAAGTAAATYSFGVSASNSNPALDSAVDSTSCSADYLTIPGGEADDPAAMFAVNGMTAVFNRFCGRVLSAIAATATFTDSVCSQSLPFTIGFKSDDDELNTGIATNAAVDELNGMPGGIVGFYLRWVQVAC